MSLSVYRYFFYKPGTAPSQTSGLSHPGVCEPTDSADCRAKNDWTIDCTDGADFTCEGIAAEGIKINAIRDVHDCFTTL